MKRLIILILTIVVQVVQANSLSPVAAAPDTTSAKPEQAGGLRSVSIPNAGPDGLIDPIQLADPESTGECRRPCSILRTRARQDVIVFLFEHQAGNGLVRLSGDACRQRSAVQIVRSGETLDLPVSGTSNEDHHRKEITEWSLSPDYRTFYAVAVTDAKTARKMANIIDALPQRCAENTASGLMSNELRDWLAEFAMFAARYPGDFDWRAVEVRNIQ